MADEKFTDFHRQILKSIFGIPKWYVLSQNEESRLIKYFDEANDSVEQANVNRILDCSTICNEDDCFFCSEIQALCQPCSRVSTSRD